MKQQRLLFWSLRESTVTGWTGIEMAVREEGSDGAPVFTDPAVTFLQLHLLTARLGDGRAASFVTYQNDDHCGLRVELGDRSDPEPGGIFRRRELQELAIGAIDDVQVHLARRHGDIAEIDLTIGGTRLLLVAGEVWEGLDDSLKFVWLDESVLAFADPSEAARIAWLPDRKLR